MAASLVIGWLSLQSLLHLYSWVSNRQENFGVDFLWVEVLLHPLEILSAYRGRHFSLYNPKLIAVSSRITPIGSLNFPLSQASSYFRRYTPAITILTGPHGPTPDPHHGSPTYPLSHTVPSLHGPLVTILFSLLGKIHTSPLVPSLLLTFFWTVDCTIVILHFMASSNHKWALWHWIFQSPLYATSRCMYSSASAQELLIYKWKTCTCNLYF